jgi:integrase
MQPISPAQNGIYRFAPWRAVMPQLTHQLPKYRRHRASGQAIVTLQGHDHYLGPWDSRASRLAYDRLVAEWLAGGRHLRSADSTLTVDQVLARYWLRAEQHYRRNGEPTGELQDIRYALRPLQAIYGATLARDFGPLALKSLRDRLIQQDLSRRVINQRIGIVKRVFRWAVSEELVPADVVHALSTVAGLQRGRTAAREMPPVQPVDESRVSATLPFLPPVVQAMVQFQRLTGCRPSEVCRARPCDVDRSTAVWQYRPGSHKTEHHDRARVILLGPQAQAILTPYLDRPAEA